MPTEITLSAAVRSNLLSLARTQDLVGRTQGRLSTGLKVGNAIDNARAYFEAKALTDSAADMTAKKEGIDQAISSVTTALSAIESLDNIAQQMKGLTISARTSTGSELTALVAQFNELRTQIDNMSKDADYQGLNLINGTGSKLEVSFSTDTTSVLSIDSVDLTVGTGGTSTKGLAIQSAVSWSLAGNLDSALAEVTAAVSTLRGKAQSLGSNVALLQNRLGFTSTYVNTLEEGAGKLTLADINEEGANLVALQVRQQLGIQALAFAGQSEQAILSLFR